MNQANILSNEMNDEKGFSDLKNLDLFLDKISSDLKDDMPIIVTVKMHDSLVYLGLGLDISFVHVMSVSNEPPYWVTLGDTYLDGGVDFFLHGRHHTEIPRRNLIPIDETRNIIRGVLSDRF